MAIFLTRIELHSAIYSDYETLHAAMAAAGFARTIKGDNGTTYHLPTAEYYCNGSFTIDNVRAYAEAAASRTNRKFGVIVAEATRLSWSGLTPVVANARSVR